jgi:hypothetical protein
MNLSVGIVGLPNVGKSTLFNALLKKQAALAANYPFATIEPNVGVVAVPDERLERLAQIIKESDSHGLLPPIVPATVEFVDIAGLVKGASEGEGLGNKFLSHIREVNIIAHVVRVFKNSDIVREGSIDTVTDYETIHNELILADIASLSNLKEKTSKKDLQNRAEFLDKLLNHLDKANPARNFDYSREEEEFIKSLFLLTNKQEIIVLNVAEEDYSDKKTPSIIREYSKKLNVSEDDFVVVSAKIEAELADLESDEQKVYLSELGVLYPGLERLIKRAYFKLGLISFLTAGEKEVRAWTIKKGSNAVEAAGEIHTDFMKKFIKAEVVSYSDFVGSGLVSRSLGEVGWKSARAQGRARMEGRDYIMQDGDVVEFKIGR